MPRVAILSDVHGNLPALRAVLADIDRQRPDEILVGGDLVGRGPQGSLVVRTIRERGWRTIRGNHEQYLLDFRCGEIPAAWREAEEWAAARWMAAELAPQDVDFIASLPDDLVSRALPHVRLVHGTPDSANEGIGPWTSGRRICRHLESITESVLVCAHTHRPLERLFDGGQVVNVGSVGLPFNRDPRAQYAILEGRGDRVDVEFRRVDYDRGELLSIYESSGFQAAGGVTARLLRMEIEAAAPYLVPFLSWVAAEGRSPGSDSIEAFLSVYHPDRQREFFRDLEAASR
jgi:predicted phosphodiesterase